MAWAMAHKEIIRWLLFALQAFANGLIEHLHEASRNVAQDERRYTLATCAMHHGFM
jgi:hypothetical protein